MKDQSPKKFKVVHVALLLAMGLFGALVFTTINDDYDESTNAWAEETERSRRHYGLQLDLRGELAENIVLVEDTLNHYAAMAFDQAVTDRHEWGLSVCCEDSPERVFQLWAELAFDKGGDRMAMLSHLHDSEYLQLDIREANQELIVGVAALSLPVPGHPEQIVHLDNIGFNLRTPII